MKEETQTPQTLEACFAELDRILTHEEKTTIKNLPNKYATSSLHFSLGMMIRNRWQLHENSSLLRSQLCEVNYPPIHPDDLSGKILEEYYEYLNRA